MEFTVRSKGLQERLAAACGTLSVKTTIPVLACVLLDARGDGTVGIATSDLELSFASTVEAKVKKSGAAAVPARKLLEILKLLPDSEVRLRSLDNHWVELTADKRKFKLVGMAAENFPTLAQPPKSAVTIPAKILAELVERTSFAISSEESRYTLNGALLVITPSVIRMVATDGHRLSVREVQHESPGLKAESSVIVPRAALMEVAALATAAGDGSIEFASDDANLFFASGDTRITARALTGKFPNYEAVIPKKNKVRLTLEAAEFGAAVRRVAQMADARSRALKLTLNGDGVTLESSSPEYGDAKEVLETEHSGGPMVIGFNANYLLSFLAVAEGPVAVELLDEQSAGMFRPMSDPGWQYVVMPMRV